MQAACGVGNDHVVAAGGGGLDGVKDDRRRVGTFSGLHDGHPCAVSPDLQLLAGSSTEGIARSQHHPLALPGVVIGQFGNAGGLAHAVDPNDQNDGGLAAQVHLSFRRHLLGNDVAQGICRLFAGLEALFLHAVAQLVHQMDRHIAAHVGQDQLFFQLIVHVIVDHAAGERIHNAAPEAGAGLFQARFHLVFFFFSESEEPHGVLLCIFLLLYIRKPASRQPVPDPV